MRRTAQAAASVAAAFLALALGAPRSAHAQEGPAGPGNVMPGFNGPARYEASPRTRDPKLSNRAIKLFDTSRSVVGLELHMGPLWWRPAADWKSSYERGTGEIIAGTGATTSWKSLYLSGFQVTHLRILDGKRAAWTILGQELASGIRLGIFEPEVRLGLGLLTVDAFRGKYSFELLTPRVAAGVGIHAGRFRLDIQIHSEYLWRWFGEDYVFHGVSLGFRLDVPRSSNVPDFADPEKKTESSPSKRP